MCFGTGDYNRTSAVKIRCGKTLRVLWLQRHIFGFPHLWPVLLVIVQFLNRSTRVIKKVLSSSVLSLFSFRMSSNCCSLFIFSDVLLSRCFFQIYHHLYRVHPPVFRQCLLPHCCLSLVNSLKRWRDLVFEVLETSFAQNTYIFAILYQAFHTSSAFANDVTFGRNLSDFSIFAELLALKYKNKEHIFRLVVEIKTNYITK